MVRLPEIELDNRGFQELVSEARTRIARRCPSGPSTTSPTRGSR